MVLATPKVLPQMLSWNLTYLMEDRITENHCVSISREQILLTNQIRAGFTQWQSDVNLCQSSTPVSDSLLDNMIESNNFDNHAKIYLGSFDGTSYTEHSGPTFFTVSDEMTDWQNEWQNDRMMCDKYVQHSSW